MTGNHRVAPPEPVARLEPAADGPELSVIDRRLQDAGRETDLVGAGVV